MIIYSNDKELITTKVDPVYQNLELSSFYLDATNFMGERKSLF